MDKKKKISCTMCPMFCPDAEPGQKTCILYEVDVIPDYDDCYFAIYGYDY